MSTTDRTVPDLTPVEAAAVRRGACRAVHESPLADPETLPPVGAELRELAQKIDGMHDQEAPDAPGQA